MFSVGFAGTGELVRRLTRVPRARIEAAHRKVFDKYNQNAEKLVDFNEQGIYRNVDELIEIIRKEAGTISDPKKFDLIKADVTAALRQINENGKDMALATALKRAAAVGIFGTAQFLTSPDEKLVATAKGFGVGVALYGAGRFLGSQLRKLPKEFEEAALSGEATLDTARLSTVRLNSAAQELSNVIKAQIPDAIDSRRLLFYYLTKARVDRKTFKYNGKLKPITLDELRAVDKNLPEAAKTIEKYLMNIKYIWCRW